MDKGENSGAVEQRIPCSVTCGCVCWALPISHHTGSPPSLSGSQGTQRTVLTLPKMEKEHPANTCWSLLNSLAVSKCHPNLTVQFSHSVMSDSLRPHGLQHTRPPCPSPTPRVYPNSCPLIQWCHPTISSSVVPFSSCPQSFPASGSFPPLRMKWPKYCSFSFSISPSN